MTVCGLRDVKIRISSFSSSSSSFSSSRSSSPSFFFFFSSSSSSIFHLLFFLLRHWLSFFFCPLFCVRASCFVVIFSLVDLFAPCSPIRLNLFSSRLPLSRCQFTFFTTSFVTPLRVNLSALLRNGTLLFWNGPPLFLTYAATRSVSNGRRLRGCFGKLVGRGGVRLGRACVHGCSRLSL